MPCESFGRDQQVRRRMVACGGEFGAHFVRRFAFHQRFGLREEVGEQHRMMVAERIERARRRQKITRDQLGALMNQLVESVLTIRSRFAPQNRPGAVIDRSPVKR